MKNYKTTIFGSLAALGMYLAQSQTGVLQLIGQGLQIIGTLLTGVSAADGSKTQAPSN